MSKEIQLTEHFTYKKLLKFTLPSIVMMVFSMIYGVADGIFISNFVGKTPFVAVTLIMPLLNLFATVGLMVGAGGSALVAKTLGEGDNKRANQIFSMLVYLLIGFGILLSSVCIVYIREISTGLGAEGEVTEDCIVYAIIQLVAMPAFILQNAFQSFFVTADRPKLGLIVTVTAGATNIILDCILVIGLRLGLPAAAITTSIGQIVGGVVPIVYFARKNTSMLKLVCPWFNCAALLKTLSNGLSEFVTNASMSVVGMMYNFQLLRYIGNDGVAAFGVIMYIAFIFTGVFLGYSMGVMPVVGYNYGAQNHKELRSLLRKSIALIACGGLLITVAAILTSRPLASIFVGYDLQLLSMTSRAFQLYSLSFLVGGFNLFGTAFFTGLNNGFVSGGLSFARTMIFEIGSVLLLPLMFGINGIWLSIVCAETLTLVLTYGLLMKYRTRYKY